MHSPDIERKLILYNNMSFHRNKHLYLKINRNIRFLALKFIREFAVRKFHLRNDVP